VNTLENSLDKLPKWAQHEVTVLKRNYSDALKELGNIRNNVKSNTYHGNEHYGNLSYLKNNESVTFCFADGEFQVRIDGNRLNIMGSYFNGEMCVFPNVSNVVEIGISK